MTKANILIVEDDPLQRRLIKKNLETEGFTVFDVSNGKDALDVISRYPVDIAVVDYKLENEVGVDVVAAIIKTNPLITPIVVTAFGNIENAVEALKRGAYDYIVKPLDFKKFLHVIGRALERQKLKKEISHLRSSLEDRFSFKNFIAVSPAMEEVTLLMAKAARSEATVLISGETGTGKDMTAKTIHYSSKRKEGPFMAVNIPSLPESLVESELFGAEKGAFTGSHERKQGKFEAASGGTLFLDEIGDLTPQIQVKLLRFLQEKELYRLGSSKPVKVDVRIVAATNRDLEKMMEEEKFRADLYYRLNILRIHVPPLRQRKEDLLPLSDLILRKLSAREGKKIEGISAEAMNMLMNYSFPGNIRELENILERAVVLSEEGLITQADLPLFLRDRKEESRDSMGQSLTDRIKHIEIREIKKALLDHGGVKSKAASSLGITERMLAYKIKIYGLKSE